MPEHLTHAGGEVQCCLVCPSFVGASCAFGASGGLFFYEESGLCDVGCGADVGLSGMVKVISGMVCEFEFDK